MATTTKPMVTPHSLQGRCAAAMYAAANEGREGIPTFLQIAADDRERYERMAAAALAVAYREPVLSQYP